MKRMNSSKNDPVDQEASTKLESSDEVGTPVHTAALGVASADMLGLVKSTQADALGPVGNRSNIVASNLFEDVVSGQFDASESDEDVAVPKRVLAPMVETPKLHKVLAQSGMGSRLEMEQLILEGRISVNNEPAHIGQRIQFGDSIKVNGKPVRFRIDPPPARVIAYHKPVGEVVTHDDPQNRPTVFRRLPKLHQGKWQSVGRLDLNTEGLLLFTTSGELANNLMHPRFGLEREYAVRVLGSLNKEERNQLLQGVRLDDGIAQFGSIEEGGGEGSNCWYRVTISEGRNREVRRMLEAVGHAVSRLIRIRYGAMVLPRGLKRGAWMELDDADIQSLMKVSGGRSSSVDEGASVSNGLGSEPGGSNGRRRGGRMGGPRSSNRGPRPSGSADTKPRDPGNQPRNGRASAGKSEKSASKGAASQPDPMKTSFGYIGADSFTRQRQDVAQRGRGTKSGSRRGGRDR
ncbi:pseudouridine synthase [Rhodoferax aquaticus]|uniref:Pseudouridine synthase n=1 Tax=Rhodoferax aquaticus TaxID=2527691 RepID=A0A515EQ16_9BURK|nr:pseudouridine synthase [Rhodoferax aquaticus]QDL54736.1 rRNA pseudouridine synthase [Rhodoferax aquaticus]